MEKPAASDFPIHDLIRRRWSPRAFADTLVPADILRSLFEAARWAASSMNDQPWAYLVATKDHSENFQEMVSVLLDSNAIWAKNAPVLLLSVARLNFKRDGSPNRLALHDLGAASSNLAIQATALGLAVHQMGGIHQNKAREVFHIPEGWEPVAAMAIGYPGNPESLPENLQKRELLPRTRMPLFEFVMSGSWGQSSAIVR